MSETPTKWDLWRLPTMLLWLVVFMVGLIPSMTFTFLRDLGYVVTQNAMVNSPHVITLSLAVYVAFFVYARCLESGVQKGEAQDKALQLGVFAWLAFLPVDFYSIALAHTNPLMRDRALLYFIVAVKLASWWTLLLMFARYYLFAADSVFASVATLFPSSRRHNEQHTSTPATPSPVPAQFQPPKQGPAVAPKPVETDPK